MPLYWFLKLAWTFHPPNAMHHAINQPSDSTAVLWLLDKRELLLAAPAGVGRVGVRARKIKKNRKSKSKRVRGGLRVRRTKHNSNGVVGHLASPQRLAFLIIFGLHAIGDSKGLWGQKWRPCIITGVFQIYCYRCFPNGVQHDVWVSPRVLILALLLHIGHFGRSSSGSSFLHRCRNTQA